jgi:hypothetical protein
VSAADLAIASVVLAGALWLLYRSVVRGQGACHGCSGGSCGKRPDRAPAPQGPPRDECGFAAGSDLDLLRLGSPPKDG